jgi:hypothetical protein
MTNPGDHRVSGCSVCFLNKEEQPKSNRIWYRWLVQSEDHSVQSWATVCAKHADQSLDIVVPRYPSWIAQAVTPVFVSYYRLPDQNMGPDYDN